MKSIFYLYKNGDLIRKDNSLVLKTSKGNEYIPIEQLDIIICFSEINLNKRVLSLLKQYKVSIMFFNYYGNLIGRFSPKIHKYGKSLIEQVDCYNDERRYYIASKIEYSSISNMLAVLKYYNKKGIDLSDKITKIIAFREKISNIQDINYMLIIEANIKKIYYDSFDLILRDDNFVFEKRSKNPPENEVNAMLSYGYALLYSSVLAVLDRSSLFPQISFVHSTSKTTDSLQYDLADILKPVLIDRLVIRMIRKKQIKKEFFDFKGDKRCFLNKKGLNMFVREYDNNLKKTIKINNKYYSYKSLISREVHKLSEFIKGNKKSYNPFIMKW
ncbi:MAG TPA: CRISPR-associated endonuclease Cas1 [Bacteroidales bacterium]|nr:CRISPR-associated endonuclease Cas1 [Bacteroidales bacterium]HQA84689.1 CRISPR-associated endonuclease Cas1 [Erysipelotrichaceae bacterium]